METIIKSPDSGLLRTRPVIAKLLFDCEGFVELFEKKVKSVESMGSGSINGGSYIPNNRYLCKLSDYCTIGFRIHGLEFHGVAYRDGVYDSWIILSFVDDPVFAKVAACMLSIFDAEEYEHYKQFFVQVDGDTFDSLDSNGIVVRDLKNDKTYWYEYNG